MSVSFLWNKESQQDFLPGEKKSNFAFFSPFYGLISCYSYVPLSFLSQMIFSFKSFPFLVINFDLCLTFSPLFMLIVRGICSHIKASWGNYSKCLSCSSCCTLSTCSICNNSTENTWVLAKKERFC